MLITTSRIVANFSRNYREITYFKHSIQYILFLDGRGDISVCTVISYEPDDQGSSPTRNMNFRYLLITLWDPFTFLSGG
jgi:hypothetical protein